jgi:hypothetical protein
VSSDTLLSGGDMSASIASDPLYLHRKTHFSLHFIYAGAPVGSIYIAVSNNGVNWEVLTNSTIAVSSASTYMFNIQNTGYLMCRAHFAFTSGTGSLSVYSGTKDLT